MTNIGPRSDTFSLTVAPLVGSARPALSSDSVTLAPGASQELQVRLTPGGGATGEHSGFLIVRSTSGSTEARVPYWFAVPSKTATSITLMEANPSSIDLAGTVKIFFVRPTDAAGLPVAGLPTATATAGGGRVLGVMPHDYYPGFYQLNVQLGAMPGANTFVIEAAGARREVTISSN